MPEQNVAGFGQQQFTVEQFHELENERLAEINGFSVEHHIGASVHEIVPSLATEVEKIFSKVLQTGQPILDIELAGETNKYPGVKRIWNESWYPIRDKEGEIFALSVVVEEITERRQREEELKKSELRLKALADELERRVEERTRELNRSNQELQQFAHVISHDLKEPVRKISIYSDRIIVEGSSMLSANVAQYAVRLKAAAERLFTMINSILKYASLDGDVDISEGVNLNDVVAEILEDVDIIHEERDLKITVGELPHVKGSKVLLKQLFLNLIQNAVKFTRAAPEAKISIIGHDSQSQAQLQGRPMTQFIVADTGIGIDPAKAEEIFQPFTRLHSKDNYEGTGLGLALCRKIVDRHGGVISVESTLGEGAKFIVWLPG